MLDSALYGKVKSMTNDAPKQYLIKRYSLERLYNTKTLTYVDASQVLAYVSAGDKVRVVDAATGRDVTPASLRNAI